MTTRGAKEDELYDIGRLLGKVLKNKDDQAVLDQARQEVRRIATSHPMFSSEWVPEKIRKDFDAMYCHLKFE